MHAVHRRTIDCRICLKIPAVSAMVSAAIKKNTIRFFKLYAYSLLRAHIQSVPKLFIQINIGGREHQNKYILLWYIWSLMAISDARNDLHIR